MKKRAKTKPDDKLKEQLARALADYDNLQKRVAKEKQELVKYSNQALIIKLLPVLDMLEKVYKHSQDKGLKLAINEMKVVLQEDGLEEVNPQKGEEFNEELHNAVEVVDGNQSGKIVSVVKAGWRFKDGRVIRPAGVVVTKKNTGEAKQVN